MPELLQALNKSGASALIAFKGTLSRCQMEIGLTPTILNCTASVVGPHHVEKVLVHHIEDAVALGAEAVAGHFNLYSHDANRQISNFGRLCREAEVVGIPVLAMAYPRGSADGEDNNFDDLRASDPEKYSDLVAHAVRVAVELGADFVKTQYTGSPGTFRKVVDAACGVPLVIAGGPKRPNNDATKLALDAYLAGASGVSFGRNIFLRSNPGAFLADLKTQLSMAKHG